MPLASERRDPLSSDIHLLGDLLGRVIRRLASVETFEMVERVRALSKARRSDDDAALEAALSSLFAGVSQAEAELIARAFTTYFELINLAEERHRVRVLRERASRAHPRALRESISAAVEELWEQGVDEWEMARLLEDLHIEFVFTAHPTESKRRSVLSKLRRISQTLTDLEVRAVVPAERQALIGEIRAEVTTLWLTERSRTNQPTVTDEVRTSLYYFDATLWEALPEVYLELERALATHYPGLAPPPEFLTFGSWVGGDRDGNPNVTTDVTAETLRLHRGLAVERHRKEMRRLDRFLSISNRLGSISPELEAALAAPDSVQSAHIAYLRDRYPNEPYRLWAAIQADHLASASGDDVAARLQGRSHQPQPRVGKRSDLLGPLHLLEHSLRHSKAEAVADAPVKRLRLQAQIFGLHTARLDMRQYSEAITAALDELLQSLKLSENYAGLGPSDRSALLSDLLDQPIPDLQSLEALSPQTRDTLELLRVLERAVRYYGPEVVGPFIVSMTRSPSDLLAVLLLAYWSGLCLNSGRPEGLALVPLFETRRDLAQAADTMRTLFAHPAYKKHLEGLGGRQTVMIGYSDSNKDAGYLAANWELYLAQDKLAQACRENSVKLTLFHGRGGTIARGGGPTNRAILAQPHGSVSGRVRFTEQGEMIDENYGNPDIVRRYLEQVVHATLLASLPERLVRSAPNAAWIETMEALAADSYRAYRQLVYESPDLLTYWHQATPIHAISRLPIGSRPAQRAGDASLSGLRAIPWVFSWLQSRHSIPGWYGLGHALEAAGRGAGGLVVLQDMYREWPFFAKVIDNAQISLGKADMGIARHYAGLVEDEGVRGRIFGDIQQAYTQTIRWILRVTGQNELLDNERVLQRSIRLRNPYVDPLNFIQVRLLRAWRAMDDPQSDEGQRLLQSIFLTINGIAAGLKNTG
jgi:phosphoenolpyruvate carboxylase